MKLITRDTDYAVRAVIFIAKQRKKTISVSQLVKELNIPRSFLRKILQTLNKKRILKSYRGKEGGFSLAISPGKILLVDLIKIFQGSFRLIECFFRKRICPDVKTCKLKRKLDRIEKYVISELKTITIASLLKKGV